MSSRNRRKQEARKPTKIPWFDGSRVRADVAEVVKAVIADGEQMRSAATAPADLPGAGSSKAWRGFNGYYNHDAEQQRLLSSEAALYNRVSSAAGWIPSSQAPMPELTPRYIAQAHAKADLTGICDLKADLDHRMIKYDSKFQSSDRIRRSAVFQAPITFSPKNSTPLAVLVCNAVRAAVDEIDGFTSSLGELGICNVSGFALQELVWKPRRLRVVVNANTAVSVVSQTVESLEPVHGRNVGFNVVTDQPLLRMGNGWVDPMRNVAGQPLHKFIFHRGYGDGQARQRGYGFCGHYLYFLTGLGVNRFSVVAETYGVSTPYLLVPDGEVQPEEYVQADNFLRNLGKGKPAYLDARLGELKQTETPTGLVPIWQALLGYLDAQKAQLVVSNTLSQEMGGVGSYNAASTHADQQLATQRIDCSLIAGTMRSQLLRYILQLNARVWAAAFSPFVGGCSPADIIACCPQMKIEVKPELTQVERLKMFIDAEQHGWKVDEDQVRAECSLHAPMAADPAPAAAIPPAPDAAPTTPTTPQRPLFRELSAAPLPTDLCVMLPLPIATAQAIAIPGYEEADDLHITLTFAAGIPETATAEIAVALAQTASLWPAVKATIGGKLETFQTEDGGVVLWAPVVSEELAQLRNTVVDICTAAGCEVSDKDFVPHVSLALLPDANVPALECPVASVVLSEIAMSTSDGENFNEPSVFPLCGSIT